MRMRLAEIAELVQGKLVGDPETVITGISGIKEAKDGDITFLANPKYSALVNDTKATAIIVSYDVDVGNKQVIRAENPSFAFSKIISLISPEITCHPKGIHPLSLISNTAVIGKDTAIGAYAVIEDGAVIGDKVVVYAGCFVGRETKIGRECLVYPNVSIRERVEIGDRVIIHSGTVIGSDGFGFTAVGEVRKKIPQIGIVVIEDDVEIGANVTIDRARFDKTVIGKGTKIDNLVQIAHNAIIGENSVIVAQAGISGSTSVGRNVIIAGQAGIVGHISIGDNSVVAAQAGVTKSVKPNTTVSGYPAKPHEHAKKVNACLQNLPSAYKRIKSLETEIDKLKKVILGLKNKEN